VVTSDLASLLEVAGDAAILVDPYDTRALAESLWKVISDKNLAANLKKNGFEQLKRFSWEKTDRKTLEVYKDFESDNVE
jgi:glycosyltransferase involved in cell wall biosynthesis